MLRTVPERVSQSMALLGASQTEIAGVLRRIELCETVPAAVSDAQYVFEAAPEKLELKRSIFAEVKSHAPDQAGLASNTSVIQITGIMGNLRQPHRAPGTHWWNPPHMIPLVEVVKTEWADTKLAQDMVDLLADAGKTPVMVDKDVSGFIGNRLQHALWREAISLVENGICTAEGPIIGTILFFRLRETLADFETICLMVLGAVAIVVMLKAPKGVWGLVHDRFDLELFPLGYCVRTDRKGD